MLCPASSNGSSQHTLSSLTDTGAKQTHCQRVCAGCGQVTSHQGPEANRTHSTAAITLNTMGEATMLPAQNNDNAIPHKQSPSKWSLVPLRTLPICTVGVQPQQQNKSPHTHMGRISKTAVLSVPPAAS